MKKRTQFLLKMMRTKFFGKKTADHSDLVQQMKNLYTMNRSTLNAGSLELE